MKNDTGEKEVQNPIAVGGLRPYSSKLITCLNCGQKIGLPRKSLTTVDRGSVNVSGIYLQNSIRKSEVEEVFDDLVIN